jgi:hypothetical protein
MGVRLPSPALLKRVRNLHGMDKSFFSMAFESYSQLIVAPTHSYVHYSTLSCQCSTPTSERSDLIVNLPFTYSSVIITGSSYSSINYDLMPFTIPLKNKALL